MSNDLTDIHPGYTFDNTESSDTVTDIETGPITTVPTSAPAPITELDPASSESPAEKRQKLMGSGTYKSTEIHQIAAQTWATVEVMEAVQGQTVAVREQADAFGEWADSDRERLSIERERLALTQQQLEVAREAANTAIWGVQVAQAQVAETRVQSQLKFFEIQHLLPEGIVAQMKVALGIGGAPEVEAAVVAPVKRDEFDFS